MYFPARHPSRGIGVVDPATAMFIIAGVQTGLQMLFSRKAGKQKVAATNIVNDAERLLKQNLDNYLAVPPEKRTKQLQAQALQNFEIAWQGVLQGCNDPSLGDAGRRCIDERKQGGKFDWFAAYQTPIASDAAAGSSGNVVEDIVSNPMGNIIPLVAGAVLLVVILKQFK